MTAPEAEKLGAIVEKRMAMLEKKPEMGRYKPTVSSRHVKGLYTESTARNHLVKSDYARPAGGTDQAPNPVELLMAALAACIEAAFYEFAAHEGLALNRVAAEVEGEIDLRGMFMVDDSVRPGFQRLAYRLTINSPEDPDRVRSLAEKVIAHCPVVDSLLHPVDLQGEIVVDG